MPLAVPSLTDEPPLALLLSLQILRSTQADLNQHLPVSQVGIGSGKGQAWLGGDCAYLRPDGQC